MSAYGITVNTAGYVFNGSGGTASRLVITGYHNDPSVTGGGINANQSVTFNVPITVGAPLTWTTGTNTTTSPQSTGPST